MRKLAPEIERLMWLVAEDRDPKAIAEFEQRFPELREDLARHIAMVQGLKSAKRVARSREIPRFTPAVQSKLRPTYHRSMYVAFAFVLAAVAFGSYAITAVNTRPTGIAQQVQQPAQVLRENPPVAKQDESPSVQPETIQPKETPPEKTAPEDPLERPVSLQVESAPLEAAIAMICQQAHLKYEMAPGMPQADVAMDYTSTSARTILEELGQQYGFTALPQESGKILIVPVRPKDDSGVSQSEPTEPKVNPSKDPATQRKPVPASSDSL